jgi:hypothetical protein
MKKLLLASASLSSCKKDNDPVATPAPGLEGRWQNVSKRVVLVPASGQPSDNTTTFPAGTYSIWVHGYRADCVQ